jgi:hypothetical protein
MSADSNKCRWKILKKKKSFIWPGVAAHTSNPSYSRGGDWEDLSSRPAGAKKKKKKKKLKDPMSVNKNLGVMVAPVIPATWKA